MEAKWHETLTHYAHERLVMEAYRDDRVTTHEAQELLGLDDRVAVYDVCKKYAIALYTLTIARKTAPLPASVVYDPRHCRDDLTQVSHCVGLVYRSPML